MSDDSTKEEEIPLFEPKWTMPQAKIKLVSLPPESDSHVTQLDIWGHMAKWATQARTKCVASVAEDVLATSP